MFQDVLLEATPAERRRRKLTLGITLLGEALVIAVLVAIPLLYLDALPGISIHEAPLTPLSLSAAPHVSGSTAPHPGAAHPSSSNAVAIFRAFNPHPLLPYGQARTNEIIGDPGPVGPEPCCGDSNIPFLPGGGSVPPPVRPAPPRGPQRLSHLDEGMIIKRVEPIYPQIARTAHIEGDVTLRATIGTSGQLENLEVMSGHPMLVRAAIDAVQQWRFKPYVLNGSPIEVQSQITVKFVLQH